MIAKRRRNLLVLAFAAAALSAACWAVGWRGAPAWADIASAPCPGNVCTQLETGTIVVGDQEVKYAYTQHLSSNGELRIRLNGGNYGTDDLISYIIFGLPPFTSWDKLANPTNGAVFLPIEDVNPGRTAYERRDNDGCLAPGASCIVDQVMSVKFTGLAPGFYDFSLSIVQNGDSGGKTLRFYVDGTAPSNDNETDAFGAVPGMDFSCADIVGGDPAKPIDNDIDFLPNCADPQCDGQIGDVGSGAECEAAESTCNDDFDNDGDGLKDCLDPDCDGKIGEYNGTALCQYGSEYGSPTVPSACGDLFDNDGDGETDCLDNVSGDANPAHLCWKQTSYGCPAMESSCSDSYDNDKDKNYDDAWDNSAASGQDCRDYDCAGNASCPSAENIPLGGGPADDALCFDGQDGDLDHLIDCGDVDDCKGVVNPGNPSQVCYLKEFSLATDELSGVGYQYCANSFDDNGDDLPGQPGSRTDCNDLSCKAAFGNCGPCPAREDFTFDSCADAVGPVTVPKDNDTDGTANCADNDCQGELGTLEHAAICAAENTSTLCGDGFDNDLSTKADCADPSCSGLFGPANKICEPSGEDACDDGADNDGDGLIDCVDADCAGKDFCAAKDWTDATCQIVPSAVGPSAFTSNDPTVLATVRVKTHVSATDVIRLTGSATYSSVTVIIGDNTDPAAYYPYGAKDAIPTCSLTDTATGLPAVRFDFGAVPGHAVQIYNKPGPDISAFDLTFTCNTPATPATIKNYPISISVLKAGGQAEYGDVDFSTTLYEATPPSITKTEAEGEVGGIMNVPYGGAGVIDPQKRRVRAIPNDPGVPPFSSGICRCEFTYFSTIYQTGPDCISPPQYILGDFTTAIDALTEDGAGNVSPTYTSPAPLLEVNATPALSSLLTVVPSKPFFRSGQMEIDLDTSFLTAVNSSGFDEDCEVYVRNESGTTYAGLPAPQLIIPGIAVPMTNAITCQGVVTLPPSMPDGKYYVTIKVTDEDGDTLESNRRAIYMCNTAAVPGGPEPTNGCQYADFDNDGAAEGLYTTVYSTSPKACDNCVGLSNANQADTNANGVGDVCEPNKQYGRCEIDKDIVCECDSDADPLCDLPCPGPSIGLDYSEPPGPPPFHKDPQMCIDAWGLCTIGGQICFTDAECTEGGIPDGTGMGLCQNGVDPCKRDADCVDFLPAPAKCTGSNRCENLLFPWLQTSFGNVFSKKRITAPDVPPTNKFNATFCVTAKEYILNFSSETGCISSDDDTVEYELPESANSYSSVLGKIDVAGLRAGRYGEVVNVQPASLLDDMLTLTNADQLRGRVFRVTGDATVSAHVFRNDVAGGAGTIFVDGGDLTITGNLTYEAAPVANLKNLASVGWIVVPDADGNKGDIYVDGSVETIVGAFYAGGDTGFWSVAPSPPSDGSTPLTVHGLAVAKSFHLGRSYKSLTQGSESFIYDGRAVANPPPGFGDVTKSLPLFTDTLP